MKRLFLFIHNVVAHPMMEFVPPIGNWLHDYTAERM